MYKEKYEEKIERKGTLEHMEKVYDIEYTHFPNYVQRSRYTGLPTSVGKTVAEIKEKSGKTYKAEAKCWVMEPFTFERGEYVVTGRLLKQIGLPTSIAENVKMEKKVVNHIIPTIFPNK